MARALAALTFAAALAPPALAFPARAAAAQTFEARLDVTADRSPAALAGVGVMADAGAYVRVGVLAGAGVAYGRGGTAGPRTARAAAEVAVVGRFLLDPFRQARRGVYAGGGVGLRAGAGDRRRPFLLASVGVEGRRRGPVAPAVELGVGHGVRLAVALRRARPTRR